MKKIYSLVIGVVLAICVCCAPVFGRQDEAETESETELTYSDDDLYEMSHVIMAEAGYCSWEMMVGVGSVVMNRVEHEAFPDTVYDVIRSPGQYTCINNGSFYSEPTEEAIEAAEYVLETGGDFPEDVVYQANFSQGSGVYLTIDSGYSIMYFCFI